MIQERARKKSEIVFVFSFFGRPFFLFLPPTMPPYFSKTNKHFFLLTFFFPSLFSLSFPRKQALADASNYSGFLAPSSTSSSRRTSLDETEKTRRVKLRAMEKVDEEEEEEEEVDEEAEGKGAQDPSFSSSSSSSSSSLRDLVVARQLEVVDALCRALR